MDRYGGGTRVGGHTGGPGSRALLDHLPDMVTISDRDGRIVYANPATLKVSGFAPEEFVALDPFGRMHPEDRPRCEEAFERLLNTPGLSLDLEHRVRHRDGTWRWVEGTFTSLFDDPDVGGLLATVRDVTGRKRAEEALRESEEKYRTLFDSIDEGFCIIEMIFDEQGAPVDYRFLEANPAFIKQTGLKEAIDKTMLELAPTHETFWFDVYGRIALTGKPERFEHRAEALKRWYEVYAFRIGEPEERRVAVLFRDIAERKQRERQQEFLLKLSDALRAQPDQETIENTSLQLLAEHLRLDRAYIVTVHTTEDRADIGPESRRPDLEPVAGELRLSDFPEGVRQAEEQTVVIENIADDPTLSDLDRKSLAAIDLIACVVASARQGERNMICSLIAGMSAPRSWTAGEVALLETVAERIWVAVERARAEEALRESEERLQAALVAGRMAHWRWDPERGEVTTSDTMEELFGLRPGESWQSGSEGFGLVHPDDRARHRKLVEQAGREGTGWDSEFRIVRPRDGEVRWLEERASAATDPASGKKVISGLVWDVTERRELEEERERARARELTMLAEASERKRISRELHDRVAHGMGVAHQSLELYAALREADPTRAAEKLDLAREATRFALDQTRNLAAELKRLQDEELAEGLKAAFERLADSYVPDGTRMEVSFSGEESRVPHPVGTQVYLTMREAVRNAVRHSGCSRIAVSFEVADGEIHGSVEDDGKGFDPDSPAEGMPSWGVGLASMRERAEVAGGTLRVDSEPGEGTRVELRLPLDGRR
jgi:PAS domain S-box-containing protein